MAKTKRKELAAATNSKDRECLMSKSNDEIVPSDLPGEDSWVVVKKQRINILIPPIPGAQRSTSSIPKSAQLPQEGPTEVGNRTSQPLIETPAEAQIRPLFKINMPKLETNNISRKAQSPPPKVFALTRPRMLVTRSRSNKQQDQCGSGTSILEPNDSALVKTHKPSPTFGISRNVKRWRLMTGHSNLNDGKSLLGNQMMRRSNLDRKIIRAGGLSQWLVSIGLEEFVKIFEVKKVSKFQLVNMSMQKLKDMGASAVGPRRKLMHAIDCLCQPNCFQAL